MIRAFTAWSWLVAVTGTAVMVAPHVPMLALSALVTRSQVRIGTRRSDGVRGDSEGRVATQ